MGISANGQGTDGTLTFHNGSPGGTHIIDFAGYYIGD
jgi:hypothetical protein